MIVSAAVNQEFQRLSPYIIRLHENVRATLLTYCSKNNFAFIDRTKTVESLSEKIETGRFKEWSEIDDFYAATIIIPNLNIESEVIAFLKTTFNEVKLKKRGETYKAPDVFRFDSTRFIATLKQSGTATEITKINFEVQIKTAFEHAWSVATHSLVYKSNEIDWKLLRIAAQLKSSVEQLDIIVSSAQEINSHVVEHSWGEVKIKKYILEETRKFLSNPNVPEELKPKDPSRFSDNLYSFFKPLINERDTNNEILFKKKLEPFFLRAIEFANTMTAESFPRSISLIQYFIGIAYEMGYTPNVGKYVPLITIEMETIFPKTKNIKNRFKI